MKAKMIIPCLNYADALAAIEWLCKAFGFEKHLVVPGEEGQIIHAELILGDAMIMLGSCDSGTEFSKMVKRPADVGGIETQSPYIVVDDTEIDCHYANAKGNGARIVIDLKAEDYGGKNYSCYDLEGHLWSFGSYDPLKQNG